MSSSSSSSLPHIVLLPSSGMGHLTPFLRLAASLTSHDVKLTLITSHPTVSLAESQTLEDFSRSFPQVSHQKMTVPPISTSSDDPFTLRCEAVRQSARLLSPILASLSPPVSAVVTDMSLTSMVVPITKQLGLPNYIFFTSSVRMLVIYAMYHQKAAEFEGEGDDLMVPGLGQIPKSWLPTPLLSKGNNLLKTYCKENGEMFLESNGILINTFEDFERDSLVALNNGLVVVMDGFPPVIAIGPLPPHTFETGDVVTWLNHQPARSVIYVSFGSKAAISREQMVELGNGLVSSKCKFVWIVKGSKVDREDQHELEEMVGMEVLKRAEESGIVLKTWINQEKVLSNPAIGGFLSHCGWNSVTEAIWHGIPILAWPQNADQKVNADLVERNEVGIWEKGWGWGGKDVVGSEEIAKTIEEFMANKMLWNQAKEIRDKARNAVKPEGSSENNLVDLIQSLRERQNGV